MNSESNAGRTASFNGYDIYFEVRGEVHPHVLHYFVKAAISFLRSQWRPQ